jgi:hypothetical protein
MGDDGDEVIELKPVGACHTASTAAVLAKEVHVREAWSELLQSKPSMGLAVIWRRGDDIGDLKVEPVVGNFTKPIFDLRLETSLCCCDIRVEWVGREVLADGVAPIDDAVSVGVVRVSRGLYFIVGQKEERSSVPTITRFDAIHSVI